MNAGLLLISRARARSFPPMMMRRLAPFSLILALSLPAAASADCTVRYKAKQDDPLQLQAGEMTLPAPGLRVGTCSRWPPTR